MKVLILSPHFDDVPLSVGQRLLGNEFAADSVTVGVVFSRSNWCVWFRPTRRRWPLVTAVRMAEEARNSRRFGYRVRLGGFEEVMLRTGVTAAAAMRDPSTPLEAWLVDRVEARIRSWAADADRVIAPLGVGDHIDHRVVAAAALRVAEGRRVEFYEDRPYASQTSPAAIAEQASAVPAMSVLDEGPVVTDLKRQRIWYPSQFHPVFDAAVALDLDESRRERLWVVDPARSTAQP